MVTFLCKFAIILALLAPALTASDCALQDENGNTPLHRIVTIFIHAHETNLPDIKSACFEKAQKIIQNDVNAAFAPNTKGKTPRDLIKVALNKVATTTPGGFHPDFKHPYKDMLTLLLQIPSATSFNSQP